MRLCIHFSYDAQRPSYQNPQRRYVAVRLRNEERPSVFFGTLPVFWTSRSPSLPTPLTIVNFHIFSVTYPFCSSTYFLTMMMIDHDAFLPAVVMTSYTPCCTNISRQYDGTHYYDNTTQHGDEYNSTPRTSLPLPVDSTRTSEFNVTVHNDKQIDSAHYATHDISTSQSLAHTCSDRTTDSTYIVICSGRQHCVAVPFIDELSSSQCRTRHLPTGGVPRNGYVLVLNPNSMPTCASLGSVNPNHIMVARQTPVLAHILTGRRVPSPETPTCLNLNLVPSTDLNCSNPCSFSFQPSPNTSSTCPYCWEKEILIPCAHFFLQNCSHTTNTSSSTFATLTMANPAPTRSPPTKANPPSAHCVKPTKHMANYVAADGDFAAPFDAIKNAVLPCNISNIYAATSNHSTNTYSTAETNTFTPKKSTNKAPGDFQRARTALTPEQESATISRFLALVEQERIQDNKTRVTNACNPSNEAGYRNGSLPFYFHRKRRHQRHRSRRTQKRQ